MVKVLQEQALKAQPGSFLHQLPEAGLIPPELQTPSTPGLYSSSVELTKLQANYSSKCFLQTLGTQASAKEAQNQGGRESCFLAVVYFVIFCCCVLKQGLLQLRLSQVHFVPQDDLELLILLPCCPSAQFHAFDLHTNRFGTPARDMVRAVQSHKQYTQTQINLPLQLLTPKPKLRNITFCLNPETT